MAEEKLTAKQLAPFIGNQCYFNNGRTFEKGELTLTMLQRYDKGDCLQIIPILRPLASLTPAELKEWIGEDFIEQQASEIIKSIGSSLFSLYVVLSEFGNHESLFKLFENGMDVFNWIDRDLASDSKDELQEALKYMNLKRN